MSSSQVRTNIESFLKTGIPTENFIDLSTDYEEFMDFLDSHGLQPDSKWVGIQYLPSDEFPVDVVGEYKKGCYREEGIINLYVAEPAHFTVASSIVSRADAIRDLLRGARIANNIVIERVTPVVFGRGATIDFEGGHTSGVISVDYRRDFTIT